MKKNFTCGLVAALLSLWVGTTATAQNAQQRSEIVKEYNQSQIKSLADQFQSDFELQQKEVEAYSKMHNIPMVRENQAGVKEYLVRVENGIPLYRSTFYNVEAAQTTGTDKLYSGGGLGLSLSGQGYTIAIWDGGAVRGSHELLSGKVTQRDNATSYDDHPTHVAGTMVGKSLSGQGAQARGMAYDANLDAYDWNNDLNEMASAANNGLLVSNHSYGYTFNEQLRGKYGTDTRDTDDLLYNAPYYTVVAAAGNDGTTAYGYERTGDDRYNLLTAGMSTAKNNIVVAAVNPVANYNGPNSVQMSSFSSWGPTADNRVKPDISADGVNLWSSVASSNTSYGFMSGTSMASPNTSGSLILLQQLSNNLFNQSMKAATLKAVILNTAKATGANNGPDPKYGFGLLDMEGAAQLLLDYEEDKGPFADELTLNNGATYTQTVTATGNGPIKVTIAWTDPAPSNISGFYTGKVLVNDLDMRITEGNNTYYPWRLGNTYSSPAVNDGDNSVDNVEKIEIPNPVAGKEYKITVTHKGNLQNGSQNFSIAATGIQGSVEDPGNGTCTGPTNLSIENLTVNSADLHWTPGSDQNQWEVSFGLKNFNPENGTKGIMDEPVAYMVDLDEDTDYQVYVRTVCSGNEKSEWVGPIDFRTSDTSQPSCAGPTNLSVENVTENSADFYWTPASGQSEWEVSFGPANFNPDNGIKGIMNSPEAYMIDLDNNTNYQVYVRALCGNNQSSDWMGPVDFKTSSTSAPTCAKPSNLYVSNITSNSASVYWSPNAGQSQWEVSFGYRNFDPEYGTKGIMNSPEAHMINLYTYTDYQVYVRTVCGNNEKSDWAGPADFKTAYYYNYSITDEDFSYYPNPFVETLHLQAADIIQEVNLFNELGQNVGTYQPNSNEYDLDGQNLSEGVYIMGVKINDEVKTYKVIKK